MNDKTKGLIAGFELSLGVLECLKEVNGIPESTIYIGLGSNYELCAKILEALTSSQAITVKNHFVTKGPKFQVCIENGNKMLAKLKAA